MEVSRELSQVEGLRYSMSIVGRNNRIKTSKESVQLAPQALSASGVLTPAVAFHGTSFLDRLQALSAGMCVTRFVWNNTLSMFSRKDSLIDFPLEAGLSACCELLCSDRMLYDLRTNHPFSVVTTSKALVSTCYY